MSKEVRLGSKVRKLRTGRGLTQVDMATQLGISASYLNLIEHNQRPLTVPLLLKLGEQFGVNLQEFAQGDRGNLMADLTEVFGDAIFEGHEVKPSDLQDLISSSPALSGAIVALYRGYRVSQDEANTLADRLSDSGLLADAGANQLPTEEVTDFLQSANNYFRELEEAAENLWRDAPLKIGGLEAGLIHYLREALGVQVKVPSTRDEQDIVRHFDPETKELLLSEILPAHTREFQLAHQIGLLTQRTIFDRIMKDATLSSEDSEALCRVALANYFAGAVVMPYNELLDAAKALRYDVELLEQRFGTSFEQVCHRLTNLNAPGNCGVPFHLVRVDMAGNVSKRFNGSGIRIARYGGACPRWNVHEAFLTPGMIRIQLSREVDGRTYFCIARSVRKAGGGFHVPQSRFAIGLGCEVGHAEELVYSDGLSLENPEFLVPIGPGCRLCERLDCRQRAFPPIRHRTDIDENVRGLSAYVSAKIDHEES